MDPLATPLLGLAERRLAYFDERQQVLARNVANIDTPGFAPSDLPTFQATLNDTLNNTLTGAGTLARTDPSHLAGLVATAPGAPVAPSLRQPDGNSVTLDTELVKLADTQGAHALVTDLWGKYMSFFRLALGRPQ